MMTAVDHFYSYLLKSRGMGWPEQTWLLQVTVRVVDSRAALGLLAEQVTGFVKFVNVSHSQILRHSDSAQRR